MSNVDQDRAKLRTHAKRHMESIVEKLKHDYE